MWSLLTQLETHRRRCCCKEGEPPRNKLQYVLFWHYGDVTVLIGQSIWSKCMCGLASVCVGEQGYTFLKVCKSQKILITCISRDNECYSICRHSWADSTTLCSRSLPGLPCRTMTRSILPRRVRHSSPTRSHDGKLCLNCRIWTHWEPMKEFIRWVVKPKSKDELVDRIAEFGV